MTRRHAWIALQAIVTAVVLVWLFRRIDQRAFRALFVATPLWYYAVSLAVIVGGQLLYAWRWRLLLVANGVHVGPGLVLRQYYVSLFINNFLPGTVGGDVAKVYYLGRQHGYGAVTASVLLDRLLGIGILALASAAALWLTPLASPRLLAARVAVSLIAAGIAVVVVVALTGTGGLRERLARFGRGAERVGERLQRFRLDVAAPVRQPAVVVQAAAVVIGYFVAVTFVYLWFVELNSPARPTFLEMFMVATSTSVLSNVPLSLNGLGVREQLHVWLLEPLGVPAEVALALSLLVYGHLLVSSLAGLVLWLRMPATGAGVVERAGA